MTEIREPGSRYICVNDGSYSHYISKLYWHIIKSEVDPTRQAS